MSAEQSMPATVQAFLDDFWIMVASGADEDMQSAYSLVMWSFEFLGWALSMSKFEMEGKLKCDGVILGHDVDAQTATRGVTEDKKTRVRQSAAILLQSVAWN